MIKKQISQSCGVYFFHDKRGRVLYIGKAVNLRNRIKSYFADKSSNSRIAKLFEISRKITWQETDSEIEALILESQLIKKHKPPFNVMLRDDKQYFYVGFTKEVFPRLIVTHQPFTIYRNMGVLFWVGPFTDGSALKTTLRLLRRIFPYCTCKQKHNNYCLNYHIGKCPGLCCLKQQSLNFQFPISPDLQSKSRILDFAKRNRDNFQKEYKKNVKAISDILSGKKSSLIKKLKRGLLALGGKHEFEKAIELRNKIEKLEKVFENARFLSQTKSYDTMIYHSDMNNGLTSELSELTKTLRINSLPHRIEGYDVSNIQGQFATGAMVVFTPSTGSGQVAWQPDKNQYRKFKIRSGNKPNDVAMLKEVLMRRFNHPEWPYPDLIIVDGGKAQLNIAVKAISGHRKTYGLAMTIIALIKNEKHRGDRIFVANKKAAIPLKSLPSTVRNLILQIDAEAHRFAISYYRKLHKKAASDIIEQ